MLSWRAKASFYRCDYITTLNLWSWDMCRDRDRMTSHTHTRVENGDARADPGHAKRITSLIYFGMPECPQNSWRKWIGTGCFGLPCKNCYACDLKPDKQMKTGDMQLVNTRFSHSWQTTKQTFALRSYRFISGEKISVKLNFKRDAV